MRFLLKLVALAVAAWVVAVAIVFVLYHGGKPARADAVIVLSGSRTRLPIGLRLLREGYAPLLLVSEGGRAPLERQVCGRRRAHVRCFAAVPYSTRGEAETIGRLARRLQLARIDVVTSQFHVFRAQILIGRCYHGKLRMVGAPQEWWKLPWFAVTETGKLVYQLVVTRSC
jgi:uncharacterized SAM-binding protein YcdF (DUF218 family)